MIYISRRILRHARNNKLLGNSFVQGIGAGILISGLIFLIFLHLLRLLAAWSFENGNFEPIVISKRTIPPGPRILCMVSTYPANLRTKAVHVAATWAGRCDKVVFLSTSTAGLSEREEIGQLLDILEVDTGQQRKHLWQRIKLGIQGVWARYKDDFDYLLKADDDTYVIMDNLKTLLQPLDSRSKLLLGHLQRDLDVSYMSGGSGYVISHGGVQSIVEVGLAGEAPCDLPFPVGRQLVSPDEDLQLGACAAILQFQSISSDAEEGKITFFPFKLEAFLIPQLEFKWWRKHSLECRGRFLVDCASENPVAFHYVSAVEMYKLEYLLYVARVR